MRAPRCLGSAAMVSHGLGRGFEQDVVDHGLVLIGDVRDGGRQREHHMEVRHRQQIGLARGEPFLGGRALTLRTMPVATAVVGDDWVCAQSSQRATWPPSAAVRQRSIADITFIWSRLTWPALARRHAAPWSRKISATSSAGRDMSRGRYAGGWSFLFFLGFLRGCDSRSSGLSMPAIMPVATRV